jgi:hypothetical protein
MIRLVVALCVLVALAFGATAAPRGIEGTWTASLKDHPPERLQFSMEIDGDGNMGMGFVRSDFSGLETVDLRSEKPVPVRFEMRREAGAVSFDGTFRRGRGTGEFVFVPDPDYPRKLEQLGVEHGGNEDMLGLTLFDVSTAFIRSMKEIGYDVSLEKYTSFRIFKVDPAYVREMSAVGFSRLSADKLVETKVHNVSPEYVRKMRASGKDLTLDELVQSRIFEVTPEFAADMAKIGYPDLDHETLVQFRIHGVSGDFVEDLRQLGYSRVPADQLVAMRIHGVTPEFIRRVEKAGYHQVPVEKLVQMRIFDIDPEMVQALDEKR